MEIIHLVLGKANPERMNGVNKVVYQLATKQAMSGRPVSVWGITKDISHNYGPRNFNTTLFKAYRNPFKLDKNLKQEILNLKGNVVFHLHGGWIPTYASISLFLNTHQIPFVITPHGAYNTIAMKRSSLLKKVYFKYFEKQLLIRAKRIHSLGESELEGLSKIFPNNKSFHLPYGFDFIEKQESRSTNEKDFVIGFVGRLDIYTKGLDILLEAFEKFRNKNQNAKLWIIGDSNERAQFEQMLAEKGLQNSVVMYGSKFGEEKNQLMATMDIFVHPSRNEGLPVAVLEASSMLIPSIVTKATNISSYIQKYNAGIAITDENPEELTKAMLQLYNLWENNQMDELKNNARSMVIEAFNWNYITNEFDKLYS